MGWQMTQDIKENNVFKGISKLERKVAFSVTGMIYSAFLAVALIVNLLAAICIVNLIKHLIKILH
jgi:hypothetical protein